KFLALNAADINEDGVFDLIAVRDDGVVQRLSDKEKDKSWDIAELARWPELAGAGTVQLFVEDFDNNGAMDLLIAGSSGARLWLCDEHGKFVPSAVVIPEAVFGVADLNARGRLDLIALAGDGGPVQRLNHGALNYNWLSIRPVAVDRRQEQVSS